MRTVGESEDHARGRTGLAMAAGEVSALRERLRQQANSLRTQADEIEKFLLTLKPQAQTWYNTFDAENDANGRGKPGA
jgi:hypothetical protein